MDDDAAVKADMVFPISRRHSAGWDSSRAHVSSLDKHCTRFLGGTRNPFARLARNFSRRLASRRCVSQTAINYLKSDIHELK